MKIVISLSIALGLASSLMAWEYGSNNNQGPSDNWVYPTSWTQGCPSAQAKPSVQKTKPKITIGGHRALEQQHENLIIMFTKEACPYCQYMKPIMEQVEEKFGKDIKFLYVDISENPQYPSQYGFQTVPQIFYFKSGKKLDVHGSDDKTMTVEKVEEKIRTFWKILDESDEAPRKPGV